MVLRGRVRNLPLGGVSRQVYRHRDGGTRRSCVGTRSDDRERSAAVRLAVASHLLDALAVWPLSRAVNWGTRMFATGERGRYSSRSGGVERRLGPMFGRDAERAQIERVLDATAAGPAGLALEGTPGIGKTTLWRAAVQSARGRGYRVLTTAPGEPDAVLAFVGLGDLFDEAVPEFAADLPDPQREALAGALSLDRAPEGAAESTALPRAILTMIRRLAQNGPMVLAIDDEQWLDRASARVLAFALCRLRDEPVCVLLTRRVESDGALWPALARNFGSDGLRALTVAPLDPGTLDALLRAQLGRTIPRPVLRRVHATSGGNPLFALAIAREFDASVARPDDIPIPRTLSDAMQQRLRGIDDRAYDPLLTIAAVSQPTLLTLQAALPDFRLSDLDSAVRAEIIEVTRERFRFTHPLLASTHYASAPAVKRRELHRVLADVLEDEEERARHLALGADAPDRQIALALEQAADLATARGAPEAAALLLEDAATLTPIDTVEARWSRAIAAAERHLAGGNAARARELLEALMPELPKGPIRARALLQLAPTRTDDGTVIEAMLEQALAEAGDHHRLRAEIETWLSITCSNRAKFAAMLEHADRALAAAERVGDPGLLARALTEHEAVACITGRAVDFDNLRRAIELEDPSMATTWFSPSGTLAEIQFWSDDHEAGRPGLEKAVERARERGEEYDYASLLHALAMLEWYAGNREVAERHCATVDAAIRDQGMHSLDLWLAWSDALFAAGRGDLEQARTLAGEAIQLAQRNADPLVGSHPTIVLATVELWTGSPARAHELLGPVRESFLASGFGQLGSLFLGLWWCDIEALIALGQLDEAQLVVDDLRSRAETYANPNAMAIGERCRGLLLAARGDVPAAIGALEAALVEHERRPLAPEIARTLLELGTVQRRAKQKNAAKQTLERSLAMFEPMAAQMWVNRTRDELSRIGLRRPAVSEGLTAAQTRVAELVVEGMSNREIAVTLYMSPRSVEAHLTKIYREYGVRSRAQLVAALSATPESASNGAAAPSGPPS
jgi:DNA-binding CsgD family transcriptional regulator